MHPSLSAFTSPFGVLGFLAVQFSPRQAQLEEMAQMERLELLRGFAAFSDLEDLEEMSRLKDKRGFWPVIL